MRTFSKLASLVIPVCLMGCGGDGKEKEGDGGFGEGKFTVDAPEYVASDAEVATAIAQARDTFTDFVTTSLDPDTNGVGFVANIMVDEKDEDLMNNSIQVSNIEEKSGEEFVGVISNYPTTLDGATMGDEIHFKLGHVVEWMYVDDGKVVGAQVTRVFRDRMTPEELKAHDEAIPFEY